MVTSKLDSYLHRNSVCLFSSINKVMNVCLIPGGKQTCALPFRPEEKISPESFFPWVGPHHNHSQHPLFLSRKNWGLEMHSIKPFLQTFCLLVSITRQGTAPIFSFLVAREMFVLRVIFRPLSNK